MSGPQRKPDQTAISISMSKDLLARMDERAHALGLNRSQYLAQLARQDIAAKGSLVLHEQSTAYNFNSVQNAAEKKIVAAVKKEAKTVASPPKPVK